MEEMNDLTFPGLLLMAMNMLYMKKHSFFFAYFPMLPLFCLLMSIQILEYTLAVMSSLNWSLVRTSLSDDSDSAP